MRTSSDSVLIRKTPTCLLVVFIRPEPNSDARRLRRNRGGRGDVRRSPARPGSTGMVVFPPFPTLTGHARRAPAGAGQRQGATSRMSRGADFLLHSFLHGDPVSFKEDLLARALSFLEFNKCQLGYALTHVLPSVGDPLCSFDMKCTFSPGTSSFNAELQS